MSFCIKCGSEIAAEEKFCQHCGQPVVTEDVLQQKRVAERKEIYAAIAILSTAIVIAVTAVVLHIKKSYDDRDFVKKTQIAQVLNNQTKTAQKTSDLTKRENDKQTDFIIKGKEKYVIVYTNTGYHLTGYDDKKRVKFEFVNDNNDFLDLKEWNMEIPKNGKLTKYSYDLDGVLDSKKYYNANQFYYIKEEQKNDGSFACRGIYRNSNEFIDDILIEVDILPNLSTGKYDIYRIESTTGIKSKIASLPQNDIKDYLFKYLYNL